MAAAVEDAATAAAATGSIAAAAAAGLKAGLNQTKLAAVVAEAAAAAAPPPPPPPAPLLFPNIPSLALRERIAGLSEEELATELGIKEVKKKRKERGRGLAEVAQVHAALLLWGGAKGFQVTPLTKGCQLKNCLQLCCLLFRFFLLLVLPRR